MSDIRNAGSVEDLVAVITGALLTNMQECADELANKLRQGSAEHFSSRSFNLLGKWECRMSNRIGERVYIVSWEVYFNGVRIMSNGTGYRESKEDAGRFIEKVMVRDAIRAIRNFKVCSNQSLYAEIERHQILGDNPATSKTEKSKGGRL